MSHDIERDAREDREDAERWRSRPRWQTIETAPRGKAVLVFKSNTQEQYVAALIDGGHGPGWCDQSGFEIFKVTHWRPLPANPT